MTVNHLYPTTRPTLDLNFARQKRLDPRVTFTRGSTATYVGDDGLIKTAASNEARFDHDGGTGESLGLLVEEARTNLLTYSEQFDNAAWSRALVNKEILAFGSGSVANATTAPDGTTTADLVVPNTTSALHYAAAQSKSSAAGTYSFSCYIKPAGYSWVLTQVGSGGNGAGTYFDASSGQVGSSRAYGSGISVVSSSIAKTGNGWYRCTIVVTASITLGYAEILFSNGDGLANTTFAGNGTSGIYLWGAQLETGSFPTSYIPTTSSTVTRSADVASMTGTNFSSWYNQSEGSLLAAMGKQLVSGVGNTLLRLIAIADSNSTSMSAGLGFLMGTHTGAAPRIRIRSNNVYGGGLASTIDKWAWAAADNNMSIVYDGSLDSSSTTTTMPTVDQLNLFGTCTINRLTYYPTRLTDSQLQELTR